MKKIFSLLIITGIYLFTALPVIATDDYKINFTPTFRASWPHIDRPDASDYEPSAMDDGQWRVWHCGNDIINSQGGDSIFYTSFRTDGTYDQTTIPVLRHTNNDLSEDGQGACSPTVIKHNTGLFEKKDKEYYMMYYECARRFYSDTNPNQIISGGYTQICHAISEDGINWRKYNKDLWNTQYRYGDESTEATAVVEANNTIKISNCKTQNPNQNPYGKYLASFPRDDKDCSDGVNNYGVGHPSAIVMNINGSSQIWLFYYDSTGVWENRGVYLKIGWDGFHFGTPVKTNLTNPAKIKYLKMPIGGHDGVFIATMGLAANNYYAYSYDGLQWTWSDPYCYEGASFPGCFPQPGTEFLKIGQAVSSHCAAPGYAGIVSDPQGILTSTTVNMFSGEGFWGQHDSCTSSNSCTCYSIKEDDPPCSLTDPACNYPQKGRGSTWAMHVISGNFSFITPTPIPPTSTPIPPSITPIPPSPTPTSIPGDITGINGIPDGVVNIYDYNKLIGDFGKTGSPGFTVSDIDKNGIVDIYDYNTLVGNFGLPR